MRNALYNPNQYGLKVSSEAEQVWHNDYEAATSFRMNFIVDGVHIISCRNDGSEMEKTAASLSRLPLEQRLTIHQIWCDSESSLFLVYIDNWVRPLGKQVGELLYLAFKEEFGSRRAVYVSDVQGLVSITR